MENRFATEVLMKSASNYPISKGDVLGHEFHGNQYAAAARSLQDAAGRLSAQSRQSSHDQIAAQHTELAQKHSEAASEAKDAGQKDVAALHRAAADAHTAAAEAHANGTAVGQGNEAKYAAYHQAWDASRAASDASGAVVGKAPWSASGSIFGKAQFITKGDVLGHPFHGNQYSQAEALQDRLRSYKASHLDAAIEHGNIGRAHKADMQQAMQRGDVKSYDAHLKAAEAHFKAASAHMKVAQIENRMRASQGGPTMTRANNAAMKATRAAVDASYAIG